MPGPSLDRIRALAGLLDHPELTYPSIQVTGTNGKTTTTHLAASIACAHGLTAGAYVSPHIESVTERMSVCRRAIGPDEFGEEYERLLPFLRIVDERVGPVTYFEALTALAFVWFSDKPIGLGVFEVGLGGTWDATNIVSGEVAVICPVGLDHVQILGPTVEAIAGEKSGIIKPGGTAIIREQRPEALAVIRARTEEVGAPLMLEGEAFAVERRARAVGGQVLSVRGLHGVYDDLFIPLHGEPAARNAAAAVAACEALLGRPLGEEPLKEGLAAAGVAGRLEVAGRRPLVILDGAHNPDAAEALVAGLRDAFTWERLHLVVGMFADKDVETVAATLATLGERSTSPPLPARGPPRSSG